MSSLPGIIGLMIFIYMRPHEFFPALQDLPFLYLFLAAAIGGIIKDVSDRRVKLMSTPALPWALAFVLWCVITLAIVRPDQVTIKAVGILVSLALFLIISHGVQRLQSFVKVVLVIFALGLFVAYVGADQGLSPFQCCVHDPEAGANGLCVPDGRECQVIEPDGARHDGVYDCVMSGKAALAYACERAGLFGTTSVGAGRVRYLGVLMDPNELALATAIAVPFAFAFLELRRTTFRLVLLVVTLVLVAVEIVYTQSRGGQVTFGAVLGVYFIKKYGWKRGMMVGAAMAVPMLALGGRHDEDAEASTIERLGCAAAGIQMLMAHPLIGVGYSRFPEEHGLTAHNAYILVAGELGAPGMWLFGFILYLSVKIPVSVLRFDMPESADTKLTKTLAMAMLAAFAGGSIGIYFLSWSYHYVLWIHFGLSGALYTCVKRTYPTFEVPFSWKEKRNIMMGYVVYLIVWARYVKYKNAWE
jgi:hypothetical protein